MIFFLFFLQADRTHLETEAGSETEPETGLTSSEPEFQTRKERECWHLYRRMCDKGVYVSFDTVLRLAISIQFFSRIFLQFRLKYCYEK